MKTLFSMWFVVMFVSSFCYANDLTIIKNPDGTYTYITSQEPIDESVLIETKRVLNLRKQMVEYIQGLSIEERQLLISLSDHPRDMNFQKLIDEADAHINLIDEAMK